MKFEKSGSSFSLKKKKQKEPSYEFDFSIYEREEKVREDKTVFNSVEKNARPPVTGQRSKFSPGVQELEKISMLRVQMSKIAVKIAGFTQDINHFWEFYGYMDEYWANIKDIYGKNNYDEIEQEFSKLRGLLIEYRNGSNIPYEVHAEFLKARDWVYILASRKNLGIETEKIRRSIYDKAKRAIVE